MPHDHPIRKFGVFISSVTQETKGLREILWKETYRAGHIPVVMEDDPADGRTIPAAIEQSIHEADIFVILIGQQYGKLIDPETVTSFVQHELEIARKRGLSILAFDVSIRDSPAPLPSNEMERQIDERYRKLRSSLREITQVREIELDSKHDYAAVRNEYHSALTRLAKRLTHGGWISADVYDQRADLIELGKAVSRSPFFRRFVERLNSFTTLSERTTSRSEEKEAMADFFWDQFLSRMRECDISKLFFESGSTIAYLSERFLRQLRTPSARRFSQELIVETNNILTYLEFLLVEPHFDPIDVRLFPPAPAEEYYGATFGKLTSLIPKPRPTTTYRLPAEAKNAVRKLATEIKERYGQRGIILMTASGLEMNRKCNFFGPHVGSYYNALFKLALLSSGVPVVLFLEASKIPRPFELGQCYPVCPPSGDGSWASICRSRPIAVVTDVLSEDDLDEKKASLRSLGLDVNLGGKNKRSPLSVFLACNQQFDDQLNVSQGKR